MPAIDNRVSASLSDGDRQEILAAITSIKEKLPYLLESEATTHS